MPASCQRLRGATAVVTGGASGIGAATVARLASEGAFVVVADVADDAGVAVVEELCSQGHQARYVHCDVAERADWEGLRSEVVACAEHVDVLHSNAYLEVAGAAHEVDERDWDRQMAVSLKAAYLGIRTFADLLRARGASVILTSSVHASFGLPGHPAYAAAKGGLSALTRQLAVEYGPTIRVNAVVPGPVLTGAWEGISRAERDRSAAATALGRLGRPEEVAAAVAFLASADSSFVTGSNLVVDGGWSVRKDSA